MLAPRLGERLSAARTRGVCASERLNAVMVDDTIMGFGWRDWSGSSLCSLVPIIFSNSALCILLPLLILFYLLMVVHHAWPAPGRYRSNPSNWPGGNPWRRGCLVAGYGIVSSRVPVYIYIGEVLNS